MEQLGRSFLKTKKSKGPRTDPCGTPLITLSTVEIVPLIRTVCFLFLRNAVFDSNRLLPWSFDSQLRQFFYHTFVVHPFECLFEIKITSPEEIAAGRINVNEKLV